MAYLFEIWNSRKEGDLYGVEVTHPDLPNNYRLDEFGVLQYRRPNDIVWSESVGVDMIALDNRWERMKKKVKKTFWFQYRDEVFCKNRHHEHVSVETIAYSDKENSSRLNGWKLVPVELEIEVMEE